MNLLETMRDFERQVINATLARNAGRVIRSARELGIGRNTLHRRCIDLGIPARRNRKMARKGNPHPVFTKKRKPPQRESVGRVELLLGASEALGRMKR